MPRAEGLEAELGAGVHDDRKEPRTRSRMEALYRLSRGSLDQQTGQEQPMTGTPKLVPEPRKTTRIAKYRAAASPSTSCRAHCRERGRVEVALGPDPHEVDIVVGHARHDGLDAGLGVALEGRDLETPRLLEVGSEDGDVVVPREAGDGPARLAREAREVDGSRLLEGQHVDEGLEAGGLVAEVLLIGGVGLVGRASVDRGARERGGDKREGRDADIALRQGVGLRGIARVEEGYGDVAVQSRPKKGSRSVS